MTSRPVYRYPPRSHADPCKCPCCGSAGPCYCFRNRPPARPRNTGYQPARQSPVYRRPRSHAYSCRCPRCVQRAPAMRNGDFGIIGPGLLVVAVIGFWPAMVWHGEGGPAGTAWEWNINSTIGCCVWWGLTIVPFLIAAIVSAYRKRAPRMPPRPRPPVPPLPPEGYIPPPSASSGCPHGGAVPVDLVTGERVAWLCPDCGEAKQVEPA
jgi:hypothetical protein